MAAPQLVDTPEIQPDERGLVYVGEGYWVDIETGERIFIAEQEPPAEDLQDFAKSRMIYFRNVDQDIALAESMLSHYQRRVKSLKKRRQWYEGMWGDLIHRVASALRTPKDKFVILGAGKVVYTNSPKGSVKVSDDDKALTFAKAQCPEAVATKESVLVSLLPEWRREQFFNEPDFAAEQGFEVDPPGERWKVETS